MLADFEVTFILNESLWTIKFSSPPATDTWARPFYAGFSVLPDEDNIIDRKSRS